MNALSHRSHMFAFFKNIFHGKPAPDGLHGDITSTPRSTAPGSAPAPQRPTPSPAPRAASNGAHRGTADVSLQAVLNGFPLDLKGRIKESNVGDATVTIPLDKILAQLPTGAVKISFGELRRAAPQLFTPGSDRDQTQVNLPLDEILGQVDPDLLPRRQNQKRIEVPEEIRSPFGDLGNGLIFSVGPDKGDTHAVSRAVTPAQPAPAPAAPLPPPAPMAPVFAARAAKPAPAAPVAPAPMQAAPFRSITPAQAPVTPPGKPVGAPVPVPVAPPAPVAPREVPVPKLPPVAHEPAPQPVVEGPTLMVPMIALAEGWAEALRHEIVQLNLMDAKVALPVDVVEQALKRGKVTFPWKQLRSWIRPAPLPTVSAHDGVALELPLKVIAPLFLNRHADAGKSHQKVAIDENIPNLFFGFPQSGAAGAEAPAVPAPVPTPPPAAAPAPAAGQIKPIDTNYYIWDDTADTTHFDESTFKRKDAAPATTFLTRCATPNEVVTRAAAIEGVVGALIALPDGLMVASKVSNDLNGDTLAAFLPQIFGKVSQCTKELRMGELNNLSFTVGNVPWKIFRVHAIYFAAFGRPGQALPTAQLAALAAELDRKKQ